MWVLCWITKVTVVISSAFLIITLIIICGLKDLRVSDRYRFLRHQVIALMCVNICVGVMELTHPKEKAQMTTATPPPSIPCIVLARCLHYCLSVSHLWMLALSTDVYMKAKHPLLTDQHHKRRFSNSRYICWIGPMFIFATTACIERVNQETNKPRCWLEERPPLVWILIFQVCIVLLVVLVQIGIVGCITFRLQCNFPNETRMQTFTRMRSSCRGLLLLAPVIGLTWIFWVILASCKYHSIEMYHSCATFNCLQGIFVWFSQCFCSNEVRRALSKRFKRTAPIRTIT